MEYSNSNNQECSKTVDEDEVQRKLRFRSKILDEIISSEKAYIEQLNLLLNVIHPNKYYPSQVSLIFFL